MKLWVLVVLTSVFISVLSMEGSIKKAIKMSSIKKQRRKRSTQILDVEKFRLWRAIQNYGSLAEVLTALNGKQVLKGTEGILIRCSKCSPESVRQCPVPGSLLWVEDKQTFPGDPERALHSLPPGLEVRASSIPGAGLGVWTVQDIPACTLFGPYGGELVSGNQAKSSGLYAWQVTIEGKQNMMVDGENKASSNWMRFVNCPEFENQQNVVPFEFEGEMFYRTHTRTPAGTELLVWYGDEYANKLKKMKQIKPL